MRMVIDDGAVQPRNVALVGVRNLDPPEVEFIESAGVQTGDGAVERALEGADAVYVALDCDSFDPAELAVFMPEPDGLTLVGQQPGEGLELHGDILGSRHPLVPAGVVPEVRACEPRRARPPIPGGPPWHSSGWSANVAVGTLALRAPIH